MRDHLAVFRFEQLKQISAIQVKILIQRNGQLKLLVIDRLGYHPAVMDEVTSVLHRWIHNYGHEIVDLHYLVENLLKEPFTPVRSCRPTKIIMITSHIINIIISFEFSFISVEPLKGQI